MANFDDAIVNLGKNEQAPRGALESAIARTVRNRQHGGRPIFHWWGGNSATTGPIIYRIAHPNMLEGGGKRIRAAVHAVGTGLAATTTSGVILEGYTNFQDGLTTDYPEDVAYLRNLTRDTGDDTVTGEIDDIFVGTDNIHAYAGCVYEDAIPDPVPTETVDPTKFGSTRDILGAQTGSYGSDTQLVDRFDHVWRNRRPVLNWSAANPAYINFTESSEEYRYIFDQTIGDGGTAPADDGPAMTLPCAYAGIGNNSTVRVYPFINASMSGSSDAGSIAVAHKDSNGNMQAFAALENPYLFGEPDWAWYPSLGAFDPASSPYFEAPTGVAFDRICIGARSEGPTDTVRIRSLMLLVYPSMA